MAATTASGTLHSQRSISALRYAELNPVRARLVTSADDYPWSSAAIHTGKSPDEDSTPDWLDHSTFHICGLTLDNWRTTLNHPQSRHETAAIRFINQSEAPLRDPAFIADLESRFHLGLQPRPPIRRPSLMKKPPASTITSYTSPV